MKNALAKIAKAMRKALKAITKALKSSASFIFGGKGGGVAMTAPDTDADEPEAADDDTPDGIEARREKVALERKASGLEPADLRAFAAGTTYSARAEAGKLLTRRTWNWADSLDAGQRETLKNATDEAIKAHVVGVQKIKGLSDYPPMFGKHRPDVARQMVNDLKNDGKPIDLKFHAKELDRVAQTAGKTFGKREAIPQPTGALRIKSTSASYRYNPPKPPHSIYAAAGLAA